MDLRFEITPAELREKQERGDTFFLVDVREPHENAEGKIAGSMLVPLDTLLQKMQGLKPETPLVLYCHLGVRSKEGCIALSRAGFTNVKTLRGGYDAWREEQGDL